MPSQCGWASYNLLRVWIEQKSKERGICPFFPASLVSWDISSPALGLGFTPSASPGLRSSDSEWIILYSDSHQLSWVSSLQMADGWTSQSLSLCDPIINYCYLIINLPLYTHIYPIGLFLCRTLIHTLSLYLLNEFCYGSGPKFCPGDLNCGRLHYWSQIFTLPYSLALFQVI